ncbi:MAG TPA: aromatic ring-hydroxylating dioxygenase subunit alpha [Acidimicrobiales bacterium]|jgi:phenylpropionate dioxygenase-like ring-hydroxylating dioxygenase large terminal subunit|nr:aromatic ring-hydroxylating dioxygenase subunit alpha [Acidimicrobiales bacterium]
MTVVSSSAFTAAAPEIGVRAFRDWYRSHAVLDAERERLFVRSWALVGTSEGLATPGQYMTPDVAGVPLLVIRDDEGSLRAFHNLCRHRGIPIIAGSGMSGRFLTCPYHQWSYRRDGSLAVVPQQDSEFPGIDLAALGLVPASVDEWAGMVFVRVAGGGPSLHEAFAGIDDRLKGFTDQSLVEVASVTYEAACNWKMIVENHVDVYHLWYLHQHSLGHLDHQRFDWEALEANWWSQEPHKRPEEAPSGLFGLSEIDAGTIGAHLLFPNTMIVTCGAYLATYDAVPIAPDRTRLTLRIRSTPGADGAPLVASVRAFLSEDLAACEQLQIATGSPAFSFGATALTHEEPVRRFHSALRSALS